MKPKRKVSQREVWFLALLPAALVVIVSFAFPSPADEVAKLEAQLGRAAGAGSQAQSRLRDLTEQLQESRQELKALETTEAALNAQLQSLARPVRERAAFNVAGMLDELTRRLSGHGAQVLSMEMSRAGQNAARRASQRPGSEVEAELTEWVVSVAATWPALSAALADASVFPPGLGLSAMKMDPAKGRRTLRRWELIVMVAERSP